jgi:inorganic phosphate transporter, PiT family
VLHLAIVFAACVLVAQVAGNNLSVCTGAIMASRMVSRWAGVWLAVAGYSAGFLAEGRVMRIALARLMPDRTEPLVMIALATGIVIFVIAHTRRVPHSLSQTFAAGILGIAAARHVAVDRAFVVTMLAFWIAAPLGSIALIVCIMRLSRRLINERDVWSTTARVKASMLALSFLAAFALGANTIGFVYAAVPGNPRTLAAAVLAIVVGSFAFSAGELRRIGNEIFAMRYVNAIAAQFSSILLVEVATALGVPLSYTEVFAAGVYGAGFSYRHRLLRAKSAAAIGWSWLAMLVIAFLLGYAATAVLRRAAP